MAYLEITPAYGRDYKSKATAVADFIEGKDFRDTASGQYLSIRDLTDGSYSVIIRYGKLMKVADVTTDLRRYISKL